MEGQEALMFGWKLKQLSGNDTPSQSQTSFEFAKGVEIPIILIFWFSNSLWIYLVLLIIIS